jgi:hypothetical protein
LIAHILEVLSILVTTTYWISVRRNPEVPCRICRGDGRRYGVLWTQASRACRRCGGRGLVPRLGLRVLTYLKRR